MNKNVVGVGGFPFGESNESINRINVPHDIPNDV